jgi:hypothetical protein
MTRQKWTTESELAWLKKRIPDFQEAQQTHRTGDFYNKVYDDWVEDFKTPAPTADDITAAGSLEAAERKKRKTIEKVSKFYRPFDSYSHLWFSVSPNGSITIRGLLPLHQRKASSLSRRR